MNLAMCVGFWWEEMNTIKRNLTYVVVFKYMPCELTDGHFGAFRSGSIPRQNPFVFLLPFK